jgi:hypothetical protein
MQELISPKRGNMENIGCAHVYTYIYRSTVYYIYTFVDEPSGAGAQLLLR